MPHPHPHPLRRSLLALVAAAALPLAAAAQDHWPSKPIRIVVPYPAGGSTDQLARAIQNSLGETLGQPVVIDNKAGAGGTLGTDAVAKAAPDGYTFVFGNSGPNALAGLIRKLPYDSLKDLRPLSTVAIVPMILAVPAEAPYKTLKDFVAHARMLGAALNFGSVGVGSISHLTGEHFNEMAGLKMQHIPYNGGAPMVTAFAGGQLHAAFVTGLDGASMLQAGRIRYLSVGTPKRTEVLPGVPAIAEDVPGFKSVAWFGVLAPKGLPDDIAAKMHAAIVKAVALPEVRKLFADRNVEARSSTPQELEKLIRDEIAQWGPVVSKADIKS
ncbi:MAG: tripartite tricarboxylate transporter substrate binding protein [Proteobacteria bacterium]|nr:tripartite tricarboxylate transporter substrate binding protein [Pseudomonadota bacterium]